MYSASPRRNCRRDRQRGAALILALVVFGIVALLATTLSMDFLVSVRRVENQLHGQQAMAYMVGAEAVARKLILLDSADPALNKKDHISEGWLDQPHEMPMENGVLNGVICDLQGRFNINNVGNNAATPGAHTEDQERLIRLLQTLPLDEPLDVDAATAITHAVTDWIDADDTVLFPGGAESAYYNDRDPAYRAANRPLLSVSELRLVKGITDELYRALAPHLAALPVDTPLNINTADVNILRSINVSGDLTPQDEATGAAILESRDGKPKDKLGSGFNTMDDFKGLYPGTGTTLAVGNLALRSDYFLLDTRLLFLDRTYRLHSELFRDGTDKARIIARAQNDLGSCRQEAPL